MQFPIFDRINESMKVIVEIFRELKLDDKEFALFSAFLTFSSSCKGLMNVSKCFETNYSLSKLLAKYMFERRTEHESCEQLINIAFKFEKLNLMLQTGFDEYFRQSSITQFK